MRLITNDAGEVVQSAVEAATLWENKFAAEFKGRAVMLSPAAYNATLQRQAESQLPTVRAEQQWSRSEWMHAHANAVAAMKPNRKLGHDGVPSEMMQSAGYLRCLAQLSGVTAWSPLPEAWRMGVMVAVPRTPGASLVGG